MFSATYSDEIRELAEPILRNPKPSKSRPQRTLPTAWSTRCTACPKDHKRHLLAHLINDGNWHQVLVFTRTKHGANRLTQQLEAAGISISRDSRQQEPGGSASGRWRTSRPTR